MKYKLLLIIFLAVVCSAKSAVANDYPYESDCEHYRKIYTTFDAWMKAPGTCTAGSDPESHFCKCECTAYAAYKLNNAAPSINFANDFNNQEWGNADNWSAAAYNARIARPTNPFRGDVAYWKANLNNASNSDNYGHVAWVENVEYDSQGNYTKIDISEYNYSFQHAFGTRTITNIGRPDGFIHFIERGENQVACSPYNSDKKLCWVITDDSVRCSDGSLHFFDNSSMGICQIASTNDCNGVNGTTNLAGHIGGFGGGNISDAEVSETGDDYGNLPGSVTSSGSSSSSKPELYVSKLNFRDGKTKYYIDETIHVDGYVKNSGISVDSKITKIAFKLYRFKGEKENGDTKEVGNENIKGENLGKGKTKYEEFSFDAPSTEDKYQFYAAIDTKNAVSESKETNNRSDVIVCRVHDRPDIKVADLTLNDGQVKFVIGEFPDARATFTNSGGEPFQDVPVRWYLDGNHFADDNMRHWNIEHNDEKHESVYINTSVLTTSTHILKVCADFSEDKDRSDNCKELVFEVYRDDPVVFPIQPINANTTIPVLRGDFNGDGIVNIQDIIVGLQILTGMKTTTHYDALDTLAGANGNSKVTMADVLYVLQKVSLHR